MRARSLRVMRMAVLTAVVAVGAGVVPAGPGQAAVVGLLQSPFEIANARLAAVSADSASDAWAVGVSNPAAGEFKTLILHWDGTAWAQVASPSPGHLRQPEALTGVDALSPSDAWAVGYYTVSTQVKTLIEHWDGTSWTQVSSPNPPTSQLNSVSFDSASDGWAAGSSNFFHKVLILHWNGTAWSQAANLVPYGANIAEGLAVSADSPTDAWVAGRWGVIGQDTQHNLTVHWNGDTWAPVSSPNPSSFDSLAGVSAISPTDAWAVGSARYFAADHEIGVALHWDGTRWAQVPTPSGPRGNRAITELNAVVAGSASDAWAVGSYETDAGNNEPLALRWNGVKWAEVSAASPPPGAITLTGVSLAGTNGGWAVGYNLMGSVTTTFILRWNGTKWVES